MPAKPQRTRRGPSLALILAGFLLLASIVPLVMLGLISDYVSRSVIGRDVTDYNRALVNAQRDYLDVLFQEIESLIINISGVDEIKTAIDDAAASPNDYTRLATHARIGYILSGYSGVKGLVSLDIFTPGGAHYHVGDTLNVEEINRSVLANIRDRYPGFRQSGDMAGRGRQRQQQLHPQKSHHRCQVTASLRYHFLARKTRGAAAGQFQHREPV